MVDTDVIVVLGNRLQSHRIHKELKGRADTAISLYSILTSQGETNTLLLLSGGMANQKIIISEAEIMKEYCIENQIPYDDIIIEAQSLDTIGNAFFTRKIIDSMQGVTNIYVVSSCYHMERVEYIFNMCYGHNFNMNFNYCHPFNNMLSIKSEMISLELARNFFRNVTPGNIDVIWKKLLTKHKLYMNFNK